MLAAAGALVELRIDRAGMIDRADDDAAAGGEDAGNQEYRSEIAHPPTLAAGNRRVTTQGRERGSRVSRLDAAAPAPQIEHAGRHGGPGGGFREPQIS